LGEKNTIVVNGGREIVGYKHSFKYLPLCSAAQRNVYTFVTTWRWRQNFHFLGELSL